jgi:uncharacterized protein with FMN-binding domain
MTRGKRPGGNKKVANSLVALSSAAVLGVYAAGFVRTRAAAQRFAEADQRRLPVHTPASLTVPGPSGATANPPPIPPSSAPAPGVKAVERGGPVDPGGRVDEGRNSRRRARPAAAARSTGGLAPAIAPPAAAISATAPDAPAQSAVGAAPAAAAPPPEVPPSIPAPQPVPPPAPAPPAPPHYKDGTYTGWGTSRHGDIQASVVIEGGRIASASISQCLTRYPCSWIVALPPQVAQRQSPEVDYVSGATQSTNAFYYAVVEALSKAK